MFFDVTIDFLREELIMLKRCAKCGGNLVENGDGFRCESCGWEFNFSALSYSGGVESKNTTITRTVSCDPIFKNCENPLLRRATIMMEDGDFEGAKGCLDRVLDNEPENGHAYALLMFCQYGAKSFDELSIREHDFSETSHFKNAVKFSDDELRNKLFETSAERKYLKACIHFNSAKEIDYTKYIEAEVERANKELDSAIELFKMIPGYKNAIEAVAVCEGLKQFYASDEFWYDCAVNRIEKNSMGECHHAIQILSSRKGYKDSAKKIEEYEEINENIYMEEGRRENERKAFARARKKELAKRLLGIMLLFAVISIGKLILFDLTAEALYDNNSDYDGPELFYEFVYNFGEFGTVVFLTLRAAFYCFIFSGIAVLSIKSKNFLLIPLSVIAAIVNYILPGILFYEYEYIVEFGAIGAYYFFALVFGASACFTGFFIFKDELDNNDAIGIYLSDGYKDMNKTDRKEFLTYALIPLGIALVI